MNSFFQNEIVSQLTTNSACLCDKSLTLPSTILILTIFISTIAAHFILNRFNKHILKRYLIMMFSIALFELFTAPMWISSHLSNFGYIYSDVSWILNLGWSTLILLVVIPVDSIFKKIDGWKRFLIYLGILTPLIFIFEIFIANSGIRTYSPEVWNSVSGITIFNIPVEALYYIPVFLTLAISFYKYWSFKIDRLPVVPSRKVPWLRKFILAYLGVLLFEILVEPMVVNAKLPSWSYIYNDISIIMSGLWILIIWISVTLVDKVFYYLDLTKKFILYVLIASLITFPMEAWFINNGYRVYGPSAASDFSGFKSIILHLPIEVAFAIPIYFALIIAFIRFWEIIIDNKS